MKNNGGPVFPLAGGVSFGMTIRQLYKGMAMDAALHHKNMLKRIAYQEGIDPTESVARICAEIADAMIAEDEEAAK